MKSYWIEMMLIDLRSTGNQIVANIAVPMQFEKLTLEAIVQVKKGVIAALDESFLTNKGLDWTCIVINSVTLLDE